MNRHAEFSPTSSLAISLQGLGHMPVDAEVVGQWAVHVAPEYTALRQAYTVTHVETGLAAKKGVSLDEARDLQDNLHRNVPGFNARAVPREAAVAIKSILNGIVREGRNLFLDKQQRAMQQEATEKGRDR